MNILKKRKIHIVILNLNFGLKQERSAPKENMLEFPAQMENVKDLMTMERYAKQKTHVLTPESNSSITHG